ncbi:unnamed protein product [Urochloa humidicola]
MRHEVRLSLVATPDDDGLSWRKIPGAKHPRVYYRCTRRYSQGCSATKQVQPAEENPALFDVIYHGEHTCVQRPTGAAASVAGQLAQPFSSPSTSENLGVPAKAAKWRVQDEHQELVSSALEAPSTQPADQSSTQPMPGGEAADGDVSLDALWMSIVQRRAARPVVTKNLSGGNNELPRLQRVAEKAVATRRELHKSVSGVSNISPDEFLRRVESFIRRHHEELRLKRHTNVEGTLRQAHL